MLIFLAVVAGQPVIRLGIPMVVVIYNDAAYGSEVHHVRPDGHDLGLTRFPDTDIAALARSLGFEGSRSARSPATRGWPRGWQGTATARS